MLHCLKDRNLYLGADRAIHQPTIGLGRLRGNYVPIMFRTSGYWCLVWDYYPSVVWQCTPEVITCTKWWKLGLVVKLGCWKLCCEFAHGCELDLLWLWLVGLARHILLKHTIVNDPVFLLHLYSPSLALFPRWFALPISYWEGEQGGVSDLTHSLVACTAHFWRVG